MDKSYNPVSTGERLALLRKSRGLTQNEMADLLGVSRPAYRNYENGMRDIPASALIALREQLNIDPIAMLDASDRKFSEVSPHFNIVRNMAQELDQLLDQKKSMLTNEEKWELLQFVYDDFMSYKYMLQPEYNEGKSRMDDFVKLMVKK